jgi:PKD repeat protein
LKLARVYWQWCVLMLIAASTASATTIVLPSDEQLINKSPLVVTGTVVSSSPIDRDGAIWTETIIRVENALKGGIDGDVVIREVGGVIGDRITKIYGAPHYEKGERVMAFLTPTPRGDYQTTDLYAGKMSEGFTIGGRRLWLRETVDDVTVLDRNLEPVVEGNVQRDAAAFEQFVADRVRGVASQQVYEVENPVLRGPSPEDRLRQRSDFTLIAQPTVYRWAGFDQGNVAQWRSYGTQTGYASGGIDEIRVAMGSWTGYTAAKILYTYSGVFTGTPAGLSRPNGTNEILLDDPLQEIAGTFNRSTGGVVGIGGFNGVAGSSNWAAPFAADANHAATTYRAFTIVEGNLTIQDGVSLSSNRLAEIISHEFGHTLGFGHSEDATALMYESVTGLGPALRADDQTAARWLYPANGSTGPVDPPATPRPAAPTNLTATVSGTRVNLKWTDNSSNESGFSIYYSVGNSSSFAKAGDVPAGRDAATLTVDDPGTYRVYVTAFNTGGESAASNTVPITIVITPQTPLTAVFTYTPANPLAGDPISFADRSNGSPASWFWIFGDGTTSTEQHPLKTYSTAGSYAVTFTITRGTESKTDTQMVTIGSKSPVLPPVVPYRSLVSAAAQSTGVGGSVWRTELTMFNAGSEAASIDITFVPGAGGTLQRRSVFLSPRQSRTWNNALLDIFGMTSGAGALAIEATSPTTTPVLNISSRTFNNSGIGTYGQGIPDVGTADLQRNLYITGMISNADYRTNVGLVNRSASPVSATLTLFDADGDSLGSTTVTIPASNFQQDTLGSFFDEVEGRLLSAASMHISTSAADAVSAYASVIDNRTQDPVYIQASPITSENRMTIPVVGRSEGANNTFWRSDVTLFNPGTSSVPAEISLTYGGRTGTLRLPARSTAVIADIVSVMKFDSGSGVLGVTWSGAAPIIASRTYTTTTDGGTYGQSIEPVASFGRDRYVTGLRSDVGFRSNVGFVNDSAVFIDVEAVLLDANGGRIATAQLRVPAKGLVQSSIGALFPGVNVAALGSFTLQATGSRDTLFVYGSIVDNASGDPVFFGGR